MRTFKTNVVSRSQDRSTGFLAEFSTRFALAQEEIRRAPYRVGLPGPELGRRFVEMPLPFPTEFWILENSQTGEALGRISANVSPHYRDCGFIGFFEAVDLESAQTLISTAEKWLRAHGVRKIHGPINFNTWLSYRFRMEDDGNSPRFSFEPVNPPEYPIWFREAGFEISERYHTSGLDGIEGILEGTRKDYERALAQGFTFRTWNSEKLLEEEVPRLYEISMASFQGNHLFEPVSYEFFRQLYVPLAKKAMDYSPSIFAVNPAGKEVGFFFVFIDSGYLVLKTVAIAPSARGLGISNAVLHRSTLIGHLKGVKQSMTALVKSGIQSESYAKKQNLVWRHDYALFTKEIL